jgi:hypothetical protein
MKWKRGPKGGYYRYVKPKGHKKAHKVYKRKK